MAEKPMVFGKPIEAESIPFTVGYLVAITPDLQASKKNKSSQESVAKAGQGEDLLSLLAPVDTSRETPLDTGKAKSLTEGACTECHEMDEVQEVPGRDESGWAKIVNQMIVEERAKIPPAEGRTIVRYLALTFPMRAGEANTK
jgi:hypothetical protein